MTGVPLSRSRTGVTPGETHGGDRRSTGGDAALGRAAVGYVAIVGSIAFILLPVLIGAAARDGAYSQWQIGAIGSAPMFGMFAGAIFASGALPLLFNRRGVSVVVLGLAFTYLLLLLTNHQFVTTFAVLCASGFAGATLMGVGFAVMAKAPSPDRAFAIWIAVQLTLGALAVPSFGWVMDKFGLAGGGVALSVLAATCLPALAMVPLSVLRYDVPPTLVPTPGLNGPIASGAALLAVVFFGAGIMAVWSTAEEVGRVATASLTSARAILSASLLVGIVAALGSGWCSHRLPRRTVIAAGTACAAIGAVLLALTDMAYAFPLGVILLQFGWNLAPAPQLGVLTTIDPSGRLVVTNIAAMKLGYALGPLASGLLPGPINGPSHATFVVACLTLSSIIFYRLDRQ